MGRVQLLDCFVCFGISLPQQINTFILCIFLILETQPHNSCLNSFPEISGTSVSGVAALPATFFSGTKPPIASSDSGAFPENSPQSRTEQSRARRVGESSGQGCRRTGCTRGRATGGVLVGKSARPPLKRGLPAAAALPWTLRHVFHRCVVRPACLLSARLDLRMQPFEPFPQSPGKSTSCALTQCSFSTIPRDQCQL